MLDAHSNFGLFTKGKLAVVKKQKNSFINRHFRIEHISHCNTRAKLVCKLYEFCTFSPKT